MENAAEKVEMSCATGSNHGNLGKAVFGGGLEVTA